MPVGFGDQAGDFAINIFGSRDLADVPHPRHLLAGAHWRLRDVIDDERLAWESRYEFDGGGQLSRVNKDVIGEAEFLQTGDAIPEGLAAEEAIIRLGLRDVSDTPE